MCYTGACLYENYEGECSLPRFSDYPDDAACMQWEREQEEQAVKEKGPIGGDVHRLDADNDGSACEALP